MSIDTARIELIKHIHDSRLYAALQKTVLDTNSEVYIVGGAVRDIIMGKPVNDFDTVPFGCEYETFARKLAKNMRGIAVPFKDNVRVVKDTIETDVSKPRGATIEDDLKVRDFTANNLAVRFSDGQIIGDPSDIRAKVLRMGYENAFTDDPVRIFRAFRFASSLGFSIEPNTLAKTTAQKSLLKITASERLLEELKKMIAGDSFASAVSLMNSCGVAAEIFGSGFDSDAAARAKEMCGNSLAAFTVCACREPVKITESLGYSSKDAKLTKSLLTAEKELLALDGADTRAHRIFAWKNRELLREISPCFAAKYPQKSGIAEKVFAALATIDCRKGERINGEMLKSAGYRPSPLFKQIIDETGTLLALGELEESALMGYITSKYTGGGK